MAGLHFKPLFEHLFITPLAKDKIKKTLTDIISPINLYR
jgi:hypothetical protein